MLSAKGDLLVRAGRRRPARSRDHRKHDRADSRRAAPTSSAPRGVSTRASTLRRSVRFGLGLSKIGNRLSRFVLGRDIADPLTGFFVIRRDAFLRVAPQLRDPGFKLLLDILSSDRELRHCEVPFDFGQRLHGEFEARFLRRLAVRHLSDEQAHARHRAGQPDLVPDRRRQRRLRRISPCSTPRLRRPAQFALSQTLAALAAVTSNFLLNNRLTFRDRRLRGTRLIAGYIEFLVISSIGIAANVSIATLTYEEVGQIALLAALAGIALDTLWKFVVSSRFVWILALRARSGTGSSCSGPSAYADRRCPAAPAVHRRAADLVCRHDGAGAIDDAVVVTVAADDVVRRRRTSPAAHRFRRALAFLGVKEDRPGLGVGLQRRKRPVGEDQVRLRPQPHFSGNDGMAHHHRPKSCARA